MASEESGAPWILYFAPDSYKKTALSRTDHCTWYLSTSEGVRYNWEGRAMTATEEVWLPREVHNYDLVSTYRNDGEC